MKDITMLSMFKEMPGWASGKSFPSCIILIFVIHIIRINGDRQEDSILTADSINWEFTQDVYNVSIYEDWVYRQPVHFTTKAGIFLTDTSLDCVYRLTDGDPQNFFEVDAKVVGNFCFLVIRTVSRYINLNRERTDSYQLHIKGIARYREANQRFNTPVLVNVNILDRNDLSPLFIRSGDYRERIPENTAVHESVIQIGATDADIGVNGEIYYSLLNSNNTFAIHPTTGVVTVTSALDFKDRNHYELDVIASNRNITVSGGDVRSSKTKLIIDVDQVNLHPPDIKMQMIPGMISYEVGSVYAILYISDNDTGTNGEIQSVNIVDGDPSQYFALENAGSDGQSEYRVVIQKGINPSVARIGFNLTIRAKDNGDPSLESFVRINVNLLSGLNSVPQFSQSVYVAAIQECVPVYTLVTLVSAGERGQFLYEIVNGNDRGWFAINGQSGLVSVSRDLNADTLESVNLIIVAQNINNLGRQELDQATVQINITDCNDNAPEFTTQDTSVTIDENLPTGSIIYRVAAVDRDRGENGFISYSIANTEPVPFEIEHFTGDIGIIQLLDFELMRRSYSLVIRASDWGSPYRRESQTILQIQLKDVNDNTPGFEKVDCRGHLSKESPIGEDVVTITAIDFDAGNIISYEIRSGNADNCFDISPSSGVIRTRCDMRGSNEDFRSLVVIATDGIHISEPTTVNITFVNNKRNSALANQNVKIVCTSTEIASAYEQILQTSARNNEPIPSRAGSLSMSEYQTNRFQPKFPNETPGRMTVSESKQVGDVVYHFRAQDDDHGYNSLLRYVITGGNEEGKFNISTYIGELFVIDPLDREHIDVFTLNITVFDSADYPLATSLILSIDVVDVNDNAPVFEKDTYELSVSEAEVVGKSVVQVRAYDDDLDVNAVVSYSLVAPSSYFRIDPQTGVIHISSALDREQQSVHILNVKARDNGRWFQMSSTVSVVINVADVNDNEPVFMPSNYHLHIREDLPVGAVIATLTARDPDLQSGGIVRYAILEGMDNKFDIDPVTGIMRIIASLDYEQKQVYNMTARAKDRGEPSLFSRCVVLVEVVDVDENLFSPEFSSFYQEAEVEENKERGTEVTRVSATDRDNENPLASPRDYAVTYSIVGGDGLGKFTIDNEGVIRTNAVLDRESKWFYWLTVVATDGAVVPRTSWLEVYILVRDVNDNIPCTPLPVYYPTVMENSAEGVVIRELQAVDLDASENNQLTYEITSGNPQGFFAIDSQTGRITTTSRSLDREKQEEHILEVTIRDSGAPVLSSTTRVVVRVLDENDNAPVFMESIYRISIPEMGSPGYDLPLHRVIAKDADSADNADISYSISSGKGNGRFLIYPKTGMIYSEKEFTTGMSFDLIIEATDNGLLPLTGTTRVLFTVVSRPETSAHAPVFLLGGSSSEAGALGGGGAGEGSRPQSGGGLGGAREEVFENLDVGSRIRTPRAVEGDGDTIWYSIVGGNEDDVFAIDSHMGMVLLATPLDREKRASYNLTLQVSDGVHYSTCWLHITVLDVNDNRPVFDQDSYEVSVSEHLPAGTSLLAITATDADEDKRLFYTLHAVADEASKTKFQIDSETDDAGRWTGVLSTTAALNRESVATHVLTIMVRDQGLSKRSLAYVTVRVNDYNDHAPEFLQAAFGASVHETCALGTGVVKVMAIDRDHGRNAQLSYSIVSGNTGNTFAIDPSLGVVTVAKPLDRLKYATYSLTVQASDRGIPPLSNTTLVNINVTIPDNAPPKFPFSDIMAEIHENKPDMSVVATVTATSMSSLSYQLYGSDARYFTVNPSSGVIVTRREFDFEERDFYNNITVRATNLMNVYSEVHFLVHIVDVNDNAPVFDHVLHNGSVSENVRPGATVLSNVSAPLVVRATDFDSGMNSLLVYSIVELSGRENFEIDRNTGAIKTRMFLDREHIAVHTFHVQVVDSGTPQLTSQVFAEVNIHVIDVNDCQPVFTQSHYEATVLLPTYENVVVVEAKAADLDSPENAELCFRLIGGNDEGVFAIDASTGVVSMQTEGTALLDSYELTVLATDGVFETTCQVTVNVDMAHKSGLSFTQDEYSAEVTENSTQVERVTVVQARGYQLNEHLQFAILNPTAMFQIGETSGLIQSTGIAFDRETQDSYTLVVEVRDSRRPPRIAHARVFVRVRDLNDNVPLFVKQPYYTVVSLDANRGDLVRQVEAIDRDLADNGRVKYSVVGGNGAYKFQIDENSGEIFVRQLFLASEDENRMYTLRVRASDMGYEKLHSEVDVPITVKNRHTPVFSEQFYWVEIPEEVEIGSVILDVEADSSTGKKIIYSISDGNDYGEFDIHFSLGSIIVVDNLDYEIFKTYELTIRATDTMTGSFAEVKVQVNLKDINDNAPVFSATRFLGRVSEAVPVGSSALTVAAVDPDLGVNARVTYSILPFNGTSSSSSSSATYNDHQFFHIEPESGRVLTKQQLDYEQRRELSFIVMAMDSGVPRMSSSVVVTVQVTNMNDNPPVFEKSVYDVFVTDLAQRGQFVTVVSASDPDMENNMLYSIVGGNERQVFDIDTNTGIISLSSLRRPELLRDMYALNVSVTDGVFTSFARVEVTVRISNRYVPRFEHALYDVDVSENLPRNTLVTTLSARDDDQGLFGHVTYRIDSSDMSDVFNIYPDTGRLVTASVLDREQCAQYVLPIVAEDGGGRRGYTTVRVNLIDQGDNKPHFLLENYRANVPVTAAPQTIIIKVTAVDRDLGTNGDLDYTLYPGADSSQPISQWIEVERKTGAIRVKQPLQQKENKVLEFFVRATDRGSPPRENNVPVEIYVMPEHLNAPIFTRDSFNYFIAEDRDVGSIIATVSASDSNYTISYSIVSGSMPRTNNPARFDIDQDGTIRVIHPLDREELETYELTVMAQTGTVLPLVAYCHVTVQIMDVNDNPPRFEADPYEVLVVENAEIGSSLVQLIAHDADAGNNADVSFAFAETDSSMSSVFLLDSETGWLSTLVELDREVEDTYEFEVVATDRGTHVRQTDITRVRVTVMDHNDNPPVFSAATYEGQVMEDALLGTVALTVGSTDRDTGMNAEVAYSIISGDPLGQFAVRATGEVYVNKALDRETRASYNLTVVATDGAFVAQASVQITVKDVNDNAPVCQWPVYSKTVREDLPRGSFIFKINTTDADEPNTENSDLSYQLENTFDTFSIRPKDGHITNVRELDRESVARYHIRVLARDGLGLQCSTLLVLTITDTNDNTPEFVDLPLPDVYLREDAPVNTTLTRVTAVDSDVGINRRIQYGLATDSHEFFSIDTTTGIISVRKQLDRERRDQHNVTIFAQDQGTPPRHVTTSFLVHVQDVNDNRPEFEHVTYSQVVSEAMAVGSVVTRVFATSRDTGVNAEIIYRITAGNSARHFEIDPDSGAIRLVDPLDYEVGREYILTIEARDKGEPPLSNTALLRVNITDYNDNAPRFTQSEYRATVRENLAPMSSVVSVFATDVDSGSNAVITYFIVGGDPQGNFAINPQTGMLTINKALDREQVDAYVLDIHAIDQGTPTLTGSSRAYVTVIDVNDSPPQFSSDNYSANVQEDRGLGHQVLELSVTDADLAPNGAPFSFDIIDGNDYMEFRVNGQGVISTTARFDRDIKDSYQLTVRVFDAGEPPLYSDTIVNVKIIEESAYPPIVTPLSATVTTKGQEFCRSTVGRVKAIDRDPYDVLLFDIVTPYQRDNFAIHTQDGTIRVDKCIDSGVYNLNVSVTDGKYIVYGEVNVEVVPIYEELAEEAFVVRLANMLPEEFISTYRAPYIQYMARIYSVEEKEIHILSIQPSSDSIREPHPRAKRSAGSNLDVLVAVGNRDNVWRRSRAIKLVSRAKNEMERDLQISLVGVIHDVCPASACASGSECVTVVYFDETAESEPIITEGESYVSAQHQLGYECRCQPGYGGIRCEERVDVCADNPCSAPRLCVSSGRDYVCECPPGTTGPDCQHDDCEQDGCEDEVPLAMNGRSYIVWRVTAAMERELFLSLQLRTVQRDARIMHASGGLDYSILEVENGYMQYRFDCGSGEGLARSSEVRVDDGLWHSVSVERTGRSVTITIDGKYTASGSAPGSNAVLNLDRNMMYFGGEVPSSSTEVNHGFIGCLKGISLNGVALPLSGSNGVGVLHQSHSVQFHCRGIYMDGMCSAKACENGGACAMAGLQQHLCECRPRFSGARCEIDSDPCLANPCLNGGRCQNYGTEFRCTCPPAYRGARCELTSYCESSPCLHDGKCAEGQGGPLCTCFGYKGQFCADDINECLSQPCQNGGTCVNTAGSFRCNCSAHASGTLCEQLLVPPIVEGTALFGLGFESLIAIIVSILVIVLLVLMFIIVLRCRRKNKRRYDPAPTYDTSHKVTTPQLNGKCYSSDEDFKAPGNKCVSVEDNRLNNPPSPHQHLPLRRSPPPIPVRPSSYTPSAEGTLGGGVLPAAGLGLEGARNYGSAADDLNNMSTVQQPIPGYLANCAEMDIQKPLLDKSPPPPPRKMSSRNGRGWDPNIDFPDVHKKQHKVMPSDHQSAESIQLLQNDHHGDSVASLPITEVEDDLMQAEATHKKKEYHWDISDWHPSNHEPRRDLSMLPSNPPAKTNTTTSRGRRSVGRSESFRPDNFAIDPDADYSYTDFDDGDEFVNDAELTENEAASDTGDDLDDIDYDAAAYSDLLKNGLEAYLPHYSDVEPSQTGDNSVWGSRDNVLNGNYDTSTGNMADGELPNYGFSLPRPHIQSLRMKRTANASNGGGVPGSTGPRKATHRFSGDFTKQYERDTGAIPLDDLSVAGYTSMSSMANVCEIEDSEPNLSDSDSENRSNESMMLVKSSTNLHTVV